MRKRLWILLPLVILSNDSFWEIMRAFFKGIEEREAYIFLLEIIVSVIYFVLISYWNGDIRFFTEFKEKHSTIYKCIFGVSIAINCLIIYLLYGIELMIIKISGQNKKQQNFSREKETARNQLEKNKRLSLQIQNST